MRAKEARLIAITDFLGNLNIHPVFYRNFGKEHWYQSPLRDNDRNPSFKVDVVKNLRFDFGLAKGGNGLDLVCELKGLTVKDALKVLAESGLPCRVPSFSPGQCVLPVAWKKLAGEKEKNGRGYFELLAVKPLQSKPLLDYLLLRKIDLAIAKHYLQEVHFRKTGENQHYYGLGFASGDGFEVRNKGFKGFVGNHKAVSCLNLGHGKTVLVFEGFMDFLSFLTKHTLTNLSYSVIVLNSISLRQQALAKITEFSFSKVYLFLDNDLSWKQTTSFFIEHIKNVPVLDQSSLYQDYNDFNQMLMETNHD